MNSRQVTLFHSKLFNGQPLVARSDWLQLVFGPGMKCLASKSPGSWGVLYWGILEMALGFKVEKSLHLDSAEAIAYLIHGPFSRFDIFIESNGDCRLTLSLPWYFGGACGAKLFSRYALSHFCEARS